MPNWEPPPGFVSHPLGDPTEVDDDTEPAPTPAPDAPVVVQPELPLDSTVVEHPPPTEVYPEPPWRNAGAPSPEEPGDEPD